MQRFPGTKSSLKAASLEHRPQEAGNIQPSFKNAVTEPRWTL